MYRFKTNSLRTNSEHIILEDEEIENEVEEFLIEESDDTAFVRSVRELNRDLSDASFLPDYKVLPFIVITSLRFTR